MSTENGAPKAKSIDPENDFQKVEQDDKERSEKADREDGEPIAREFVRSQKGAAGDRLKYEHDPSEKPAGESA